jgi:thymidylate synthase
MNFLTAQQAFEFYWSYIQKKGLDRDDNICIFNSLFKIEFPNLNLIHTSWRKWSRKYAEREWQWYLSGDRSVTEIKKHAPIWDSMHSGDDLVWSNYGYWWKQGNQMSRVIDKLTQDPLNRKAVVVHYSAERSEEFDRDTPCNLVLNFYISEGRLHLTIMARSIDLWYGFCNDQYIFSKVMVVVAGELKLPVGSMSYFITNFHIYKKQINDYSTTDLIRNSSGVTGSSDKT